MPGFFSNWHLPASIAAATVTAFLVTERASPNLPDISFSPEGEPFKLVDSKKESFTYAYAPAIVFAEELWYAYYCSNGTGNDDWDHLRYSTSSDGTHWSHSREILRTSDPIDERATCDPSVVRYDAGDGEYYYLFYTGNRRDVQSVNFVARSTSPSGPFLKLTKRGTWESNPSDPKIILSPIHPAPDNRNWYGLGEPSVIAKDSKLYQWYTDTTSEYPTNRVAKVYFSISRDPTNWPPGHATNVFAGSVDVKYDPLTRQFILFEVSNQHARETYLAVRTSKDGITWSDPATVIPAGSMPAFTHNVGVASSATGNLDRDFIMVAYGAPYDLDPHYNNDCKIAGAPYCWAYWDLYGQRLKITPPTRD
jgi:hypothetical protein